MEKAIVRFACTQCEKCCNRSPEVELSEAAALADVFVFRLMFRLYWLPRSASDYLKTATRQDDTSAVFYQKKRLLDAYAARRYTTKIRRDGKALEFAKYLVISAMTLDTSPDRCSALQGKRCGIYDRRPLACRTVPFHHSRVSALAESDLKAFVETPDYGCDIGDTADVVLEAGEIVDTQLKQARADALALAERERRWKDSIVRQINMGASDNLSLPSLHEIEANAPFGVTTTSMRTAWQIAADSGLIGVDECKALIRKQLTVIDWELAQGECLQDARETLTEMRAEYRHHLSL